MSDFTNETVVTSEATLREVERALERLRAGNYRTCHVCDSPIEEAQLVANPLLANCPAHPELSSN